MIIQVGVVLEKIKKLSVDKLLRVDYDRRLCNIIIFKKCIFLNMYNFKMNRIFSRNCYINFY